MSFSKNNTKLVGRVARKPLWIFLIFFALAVLFLVAEGIYKDIIHDGLEPGPKLATVEYVEPTKDFPNGSVERWSYKNGFFSFDTRNARSRLIAASEETSLMVVMGASWREFYDKKNYFNNIRNDPYSEMRIIFQVRTDTGNAHTQISHDISVLGGVDQRYPDFYGYARGSGAYPRWTYIGRYPELMKPNGEPVIISCTGDDVVGIGNTKKGWCSYSFIYDDLLRAQVRFNKPLMYEFSKKHSDLVKFLESFKEER